MAERAFFKVTFFTQELPDDATHSSRHNGDGAVGLLTPRPMLLIESAKISRTPDRNPACFDQCPT
jgi:hypothetical protein